MVEKHRSGAALAVASVNNLAALREAKGWSRPQLGERMRTSGQQIERLEKGQRKLTQDWIDRAALALGVEPAEIITPLGREVVPQAPDHVPTRSVGSGETAQLLRLDLSLPMGPGATVDDYVEEEPVETDIGYMRLFTRTPVHRLRLARGIGDSMFPTLQSNDEVLIDTTQNQLLHSDRIYAASINGGATIKRLRPIDGGRRVLVIPDNKVIPPYEVEASEVRIWGMVIRFSRDV